MKIISHVTDFSDMLIKGASVVKILLVDDEIRNCQRRSPLGTRKGVTASSIGVLLKSAGLQTTSIKIDPYLNSDAGTMSPFEHGEVFVLDDGGEVDLDLGNYERFLDLNLGRDNNLTTGKIYQKGN